MSEHSIHASALFSNAQHLEALSTQEFWQYAQSLAKAAPEPSLPVDEALLCELPQGEYLLPMAALDEVISAPAHFTLLPKTPIWMPGVTAWRGETIAVVDLAAYLTQHAAQPPQDAVLAVAHQDDIALGLLISLSGSLLTLTPEQLQPAQELPALPALRRETIINLYNTIPVLSLPILLADIVHYIKMAASHE
ncbi:chemotaxis protein CheW [Tengunoibacter tsumagoiensis]|uniref:CheW-like domain-containing protein n=1 Tax=Tengunoibacter tsumagoiensis TaxID=2014871 RepID=A0A401ZVL2_9CHLR|nr:chemotaxis protein CheW [Tengunoibacter tsumagoiensis]GCE10832.1 hypothetical protein KTT_06910 [Tengunoibacter tsumagoiensis]